MNNILQVLNNPDIVEIIFLHLNLQDLLTCSGVNTAWNSLLKNPMFWLKKCVQKGLLKNDYYFSWKKAIQITMNSTKYQQSLRKNLQKILQCNLLDIPCFIDAESIQTVEEYEPEFYSILLEIAAMTNNPGVVQILVPIIDNYNDQEDNGARTLNQVAALFKNEEVINVLIPFLKNNNH